MDRKQEWNSGTLLRTSGAYWEACALHAAVALDIFTLLADGARSAAGVARGLGADEHGISALLNALTAMGLLVRENGGYADSTAGLTLLNKKSSQYIGHMIMHHRHLVDGWAQLDQAVRSGGPVAGRSYGEEIERQSFQFGMFNIASAIAPQLAAEIDLAGRRRLLDLGGGVGTYAIYFCKANPELRAAVFDLPTTRPFALETLKRFGLEDRIDFLEGDFVADRIKGQYDVVWISQILHSFSPNDCERLIANAVSAMDTGGLILIHEFFLNKTLDGPLFPALFSLNMLINHQGGRSYSEQEITAMLNRAGVDDVRRLPFQGPNDSYVISGFVKR